MYVVRLAIIIATIKITGNVQKSTEIMKLSNQLIRLPQLQETMRNMSMEMTKVSLHGSDEARPSLYYMPLITHHCILLLRTTRGVYMI